MEGLFSYDSKFFEVLGKIADVIILNLLFIISCLPIVTIGASITATYSIAMKMAKGEDIYIIKGFMKAFKENFKVSTIVWMIMIVIGSVLVFDFYISNLMANEALSIILQFGITVISILFVFMITYVYPIVAKFENTIKNSIINSILVSIQNLPYTILIILINFCSIILVSLFSNYWGQILFFYTALGFGLTIYINSIFFNKIFNKYIK